MYLSYLKLMSHPLKLWERAAETGLRETVVTRAVRRTDEFREEEDQLIN